MIGTHDSATGEKGHGLLSWLVTPFAKTQSKTIREQYEAGCRAFDIRVRRTKRGWVCAHGLWTSERTVDSILNQISCFRGRCQVDLTYEGREIDRQKFLDGVDTLKELNRRIIWGPCSIKYGKKDGVKVEYEVLSKADKGYKGGEQGFLPLDGSTWQTYLPIPWLWDRLYKRPHKFSKDKVTWVDFL